MSHRLTQEALHLPLRFQLRQASSTRTTSDSVWVRVRRGAHVGLGEGCPRPYQTGEDLPSALDWIDGLRAHSFGSVVQLRTFTETHRDALDAHPAAWCAVETAWLDLLAREAGCSVEALLGLPEPTAPLRYTVVLGLAPEAELLDRLERLQPADVKLKIGHAPAADQVLIDEVRRRVPGARIRLDANNAFNHDAEAARLHLSQLSGFWAVEEPLARGHEAQTAALARGLGVAAVLDEGALRPADLQAHAAHPADWVLNVKASRSGGVLRSQQLVAGALSLGWRIIVGAQAGESSLLTRVGWLLAAAAGPALVGIEGGVSRQLLAHEPTRPRLGLDARCCIDPTLQGLDPLGWGMAEEEPT